MNRRVEKIIEIAKTYHELTLETNSTDLDNTIKLEYSMEIEKIYKGVEKKELREDIIYLMDFLKKIERNHGKDSKKREFLLETLIYLEKL